MRYESEVEVLPSTAHISPTDINKQRRDTKVKWMLLSVTFFTLLLSGMAWVWSQPPQYRSTSLIQLSMPPLEVQAQQAETLILQQLQLSQVRLQSMSMLEKVSEQLVQHSGIQMGVESLSQMLTAEADLVSHTIELAAVGADKRVLQPILDIWLAEYLQQYQQEQQQAGGEADAALQARLRELENLIEDKHQELTEFAQQQRIVSLERDENQILNQIKSVQRSLEQAKQQRLDAQSILADIQQAETPPVNPADRNQIQTTQAELAALKKRYADMAKNFTEEYLQLDPNAVQLQRDILSVESNLTAMVQQSRIDYRQQTLAELRQSQQKIDLLNEELEQASLQAQSFSQTLSRYERLKQQLEHLQNQSQSLSNQLVELSVNKRNTASIQVLENAFQPTFPFAPNYWLNSALVIVLSLGVSVSILLIYNLIHKSSSPPQPSFTSYTVVPPSQAPMSWQDGLPPAQQPTQALQASPKQIAQQTWFRELSLNECEQVLTNSTKRGKLVICGLLSGMTLTEIQAIKKSDIDLQHNQITISGAHPRTIPLAQQVAALFDALCPADEQSETLAEDLESYAQLIDAAAHASDLPEPEQIHAQSLRHSFLMWLAKQGIKVTALENYAGEIPAAQLMNYRQTNLAQTDLQPQVVMPLNWDAALNG